MSPDSPRSRSSNLAQGPHGRRHRHHRPYRYGSEMRKYLPDFIVLVDDGKGPDDPLHLVVEIKGYRREDAKEKKSTMDTYWVPGVNHLGTYGRWAFAEFTDVFQMQDEFAKRVEAEFAAMLVRVGAGQ